MAPRGYLAASLVRPIRLTRVWMRWPVPVRWVPAAHRQWARFSRVTARAINRA